MATFDIEKINEQGKNKLIVAGSNIGVGGFITGEFRMGMGNSYVSPLQSQAQDNLSAAAQGTQAALNSVLEKFGVEGKIPSWTLKTVEQSVYTWQGSERPRFTVGFLFIAFRDTIDVRKPVNELLQAVAPTFYGVGAGSFIIPPLGYTPAGLSAKGTVTAQIGGWFRANNLLITHVDHTFSKETLPASGNYRPIYANLSVTFETYRVVEYKEISGWFI